MDQDADLVRRALEGRSEAFGALVERYQGLVHGLAFHLVGDLADVIYFPAIREFKVEGN